MRNISLHLACVFNDTNTRRLCGEAIGIITNPKCKPTEKIHKEMFDKIHYPIRKVFMDINWNLEDEMG